VTPGDLGPDLERLPGVLAATVFEDANRAPLIYLAVGPDADSEALRSAILAILRDRGLHGDPARIHIATPPRHAMSVAPLPRFTLDAMDVHRTGGWAECGVRLRTANRTTTGHGREPDTATGRSRAAARAVLQAVEALDPDLRLGLHGARPMELFGHRAVVVVVEVMAGRGHAHLTGSALIDRSEEEAAALATMGALRSWTP
jgi:hypothetical protein